MTASRCFGTYKAQKRIVILSALPRGGRPMSFREQGVARRTKLVLFCAKKQQLRKASRRSWRKAKQRDFLSLLGETCNVREACRRSGVTMSVAYRKRKTDAAFRAGWFEALTVAYQRLELVLLDRAFNGTEKVVKRRDGSEERMLEYSNQLGLALLKMHRDTAIEAQTEYAPDQVEEMRQRLFSKLQRLKARAGNEADRKQ